MKKRFILCSKKRLLIVLEGFLGKEMYLWRRKLWEIVFRGNLCDLDGVGRQRAMGRPHCRFYPIASGCCKLKDREYPAELVFWLDR